MSENYIGKTLTAVNGDLYLSPNDEQFSITDPVRRFLNKWWHHQGNVSNSSLTYDNGNDFFEYLGDGGVPFRIEISYLPEQTLREARSSDVLSLDAIEDSPFGTSQKITLKFTGQSPRGEAAIKMHFIFREIDDSNLIKGAVINGEQQREVIRHENSSFKDSVYSLQVPFSITELETFSGISNRASYVKYEPNYNYFSEDYERVLGETDLDRFSTLLPNLYILDDLTKELTGETEASLSTNLQSNPILGNRIPKLHVHATLDKRIPNKVFNFIYKTPPRQDRTFWEKAQKIKKEKGATKDFFTQWAREFKLLVDSTDPDRLQADFADAYDNIIYSRSKVEEFNALLKNKALFPMYVGIEFTTETTTEIAEALKNSKLDSLLIRDVAETRHDSEVLFVNSVETKQLSFDQYGAPVVESTFDVTTPVSKVWDLMEWWTNRISTVNNDGDIKPNLDEGFLNFNQMNNGVLVGDLFSGISEHSQFRFLRNILVMVFGSNLKEMIKKNLRTPEEIFNGTPAYSETVFYEIRKRFESSRQSFFIPNSNDIDVVKYIDTQIGYGVQSRYEIIAYQLVIGNKYEYNRLSLNGDTLEFELRQIPEVSIVETTYTREQFVTILDKPPVYPDVNLIPYRNTNDQLLIWLNSQVGEYKEVPVTLEDGDRAEFDRYHNEGVDREISAIHFKTDDPVDAFEIFRIDEKPFVGKEYEAFMGHKYATISTNGATSAAMVDKLIPNHKYYYTFRAIDKKGHISNPTAIYEVELVENGGAVYPLINTVDVFKERVKDSSRQMRKYIQIRPSFLQRLIVDSRTEQGEPSEERNANLGELVIGQVQPSVWDKKFKFRFTSKKTGKMIDLNVTFKKRNVFQ